MQAQEIERIQAKIGKVSSANYFLTLNDKISDMNQQMKKLRLEKKKVETDFRKEMYKGQGRYFLQDSRQDDEAVDKEFEEKHIRLARLKKESERIDGQNNEAVVFIEDQRKHTEVLQDRWHKLSALAKHYQVKTGKKSSFKSNKRSKSGAHKDLAHRLEILKSCIPTIEKNNAGQLEAAKKELAELRTFVKKETVILSKVKEQRKEIVVELKAITSAYDISNDMALKMKKILSVSPTRHEEKARYEEILQSSPQNEHNYNGHQKSNGKSQRQATLEIAQLGTQRHSPAKERRYLNTDTASSSKLQRIDDERSVETKSYQLESHNDSNHRISSQEPENAKVTEVDVNQEDEAHDAHQNVKSTDTKRGTEGDTNSVHSVTKPEKSHPFIRKSRSKEIHKPVEEQDTSATQNPSSETTTAHAQGESELKSGDIPDKKADSSTVNPNPEEQSASQKDTSQDHDVQLEQKVSEMQEKAEPSSTENAVYTKPKFMFKGRNKNANTSSQEHPTNTSTEVGAQQHPEGKPDESPSSEKQPNNEEKPKDSKELTLNFGGPTVSNSLSENRLSQQSVKQDDNPQKSQPEDEQQSQSRSKEAESLTLGGSSNSRLRRPLGQRAQPADNLEENSYLQMRSESKKTEPAEPKNSIWGSKPDSITSGQPESNSGFLQPASKQESKEATSNMSLNKAQPTQQPIRLNLGGPSSNQIRFRQNIDAPITHTQPTSQDPDILSFDISGSKEGNKQDKKAAIIKKKSLEELQFESTKIDKASNPSTLKLSTENQTKPEALADPFADVGGAGQHEFSSKKGIFNKKSTEGESKDKIGDLSSILSSSEKQPAPIKLSTNKPQFSWDRKEREDEDKVVKFDQEENTKVETFSSKPDVKPSSPKGLSFLDDNPKPTSGLSFLQDDTKAASSRPKFKMNRSANPDEQVTHLHLSD